MRAREGGGEREGEIGREREGGRGREWGGAREGRREREGGGGREGGMEGRREGEGGEGGRERNACIQLGSIGHTCVRIFMFYLIGSMEFITTVKSLTALDHKGLMN